MADISNNDSNSNSNNDTKGIPTEFRNLMNDFMGDILTSFPEYASTIEKYSILDDEKTLTYLFDHCKKVYPARFFDILYNNEEIFADKEIDTEFLPNIDFATIWKENITDKTRNIIWKYLQLILFCVIQNVNDASHFGNSEKLFEAIDEDEFKKKIEESMEDIGKFFEENDSMFKESTGNDASGNDFNIPMPDSEKLHEHINGLLKGKLGRLASEIAEETASEMQMDLCGNEDVNDVFSKLFKNPAKLMGMVKSIGSKIDHKIKSGQINESELMKEAGDLMQQMKNMPGMKNMDKIFKSMNMPMRGGKMNFGAMQQKFNVNMKKFNQKDRMLKKLQKRKNKTNAQSNSRNPASAHHKQEKTYQEIQAEIESIYKSFTSNETTNKKTNSNINANTIQKSMRKDKNKYLNTNKTEDGNKKKKKKKNKKKKEKEKQSEMA